MQFPPSCTKHIQKIISPGDGVECLRDGVSEYSTAILVATRPLCRVGLSPYTCWLVAAVGGADSGQWPVPYSPLAPTSLISCRSTKAELSTGRPPRFPTPRDTLLARDATSAPRRTRRPLLPSGFDLWELKLLDPSSGLTVIFNPNLKA